MATQRKVVVFLAMSLDGYIAGTDGDLSFLDTVQVEGEDYGYAAFIQTIDTVLIGRKTYEKVQELGVAFPHSDKETYVISRTPRPAQGRLQFYTGEVADLVRSLQARPGKDLFCDGGAELIHSLLCAGLIDELYLSIVPFLLGEGIGLFKDGRPKQEWVLMESKRYESGLVQLHYRLRRSLEESQ